MSPRREGFTLLELLIVVAIIAVLASLTLPALSKAKGKARAIQCMNNVRQLQLGWMTYTVDNNDLLPGNPGTSGAGLSSPYPSWVSGYLDYSGSSDNTNTAHLVGNRFGSIGIYTKSARLYHCPEDRTTATIAGTVYPRVRSYSMDGMLGILPGDDYGYLAFDRLTRVSVFSASRLFVFTDEHEDSIDDGVFAPFWIPTIDGIFPVSWQSLPSARHNGKGTLGFADGHCEFHKWTDDQIVAKPIGRRFLRIQTGPTDDMRWLLDHMTEFLPLPKR